MDDARRIALECASRLAPAGETALATVARAETFLEWLERREQPDRDTVLADMRKQPSNHDLGNADQTPSESVEAFNRRVWPEKYGGTACDDPDDMKTRIVRPPVDAA